MWPRFLISGLLLGYLTGCDREPVQQGLYYWGGEVNVVCPCGSTACFWVRGEPDVLNQLKSFVQRQTSEPYQPVFLTYRGRITDEPRAGFAVNYEGYQSIAEVLTLSVSLPENCPPP